MLAVGGQRQPLEDREIYDRVGDARYDDSAVEMLKYATKRSYTPRDGAGSRSSQGQGGGGSSDYPQVELSQPVLGADHFMENPLYGMFQDDNRGSAFFFNFVD